MFSNFDLTFTEECSSYVKKAYAKHDVILEYGSGGSTVFAAESNKLVITTETDSKWLVNLLGGAVEQGLPGSIIPIYVDVGVTKKWGYPVDETPSTKWLTYPDAPWLYCREKNINPDLILIDGRFRVASFLTSCINVVNETKLIFDDYVDRDYYHIVEEFFKPVDIIDNRMAMFNITPDKVNAKAIINYMKYYMDLR